MSDATCKTCPNWWGPSIADGEGDCRLGAPETRSQTNSWVNTTITHVTDTYHPRTPADHWCGKHPVRVAAYEAAVNLARLERLKTGPLAQVFGVGFIEEALHMQYPKTPWTDGETVGDWLKRDAASGETDAACDHPVTKGVKPGTLVVPRGSPPGTPPLEVVRIVGDFIRWKATDPAAAGTGGICRWSALELAP